MESRHGDTSNWRMTSYPEVELRRAKQSRSRLVGSFASDCGRRAGQVGRLNSRGLFNAGENPLRGDRADQRQTDPNSAKPVPQSMQATLIRCPLAVSMVLALALR